MAVSSFAAFGEEVDEPIYSIQIQTHATISVVNESGRTLVAQPNGTIEQDSGIFTSGQWAGGAPTATIQSRQTIELQSNAVKAKSPLTVRLQYRDKADPGSSVKVELHTPCEGPSTVQVEQHGHLRVNVTSTGDQTPGLAQFHVRIYEVFDKG